MCVWDSGDTGIIYFRFLCPDRVRISSLFLLSFIVKSAQCCYFNWYQKRSEVLLKEGRQTHTYNNTLLPSSSSGCARCSMVFSLHASDEDIKSLVLLCHQGGQQLAELSRCRVPCFCTVSSSSVVKMPSAVKFGQNGVDIQTLLQGSHQVPCDAILRAPFSLQWVLLGHGILVKFAALQWTYCFRHWSLTRAYTKYFSYLCMFCRIIQMCVIDHD